MRMCAIAPPVALALVVAGAWALMSPERRAWMEQPAGEPAARNQSGTGASADERSASDLLRAVKSKYAAAESYQDTGVVHMVAKAPASVRQTLPFATAFERGGRFRWEFRSRPLLGAGAEQRYVVWSKDQKSFESYWDVTKQRAKFDSFGMAMAGPTGVSGGSASAVIPILRGAGEGWVLEVSNPEDRGSEVVDGVPCRKIGGPTPQADEVTLWIDKDLLIRRVLIIRTVDPAKLTDSNGRQLQGEKFVAETTIDISPTFDQAVDDAAFEGPAAE